MVRIISALILAVMASFVFAAEPLGLVDNPPDRHIVVRGDTLWGISGKFLKQPWRWPEIWDMNKAEIKNPHLIYPGDVIMLDMSSGKPRLKLAKRHKGKKGTMVNGKLEPTVHVEDMGQVIPSIPASAIEPFLSQPLIIEPGSDEKLPKVSATPEDRFVAASGDQIFVSGVPDAGVEKWHIFRQGKPLKDPDTGLVLAHEAMFLGNARLVRPGEPATLAVTLAKQEIGLGDRLMPAAPPEIISYVPHRPEVLVNAKILSIYGGVSEGGPGSIVSITRGASDGLESGHVLALFRNRVAKNIDEDGRRTETVIPEERYALVFIFRVFDRISYGLVVDSSRSVMIGDSAKNP